MHARGDTHPAAERAQIDILRGMTPTRRLELMRALCQSSYSRSMQALAKARPHATHGELVALFVEINHGRAIADRYRAYLKRRENSSAQ